MTDVKACSDAVDIPEDHNLSTYDRYVSAMVKEEKSSRAPCSECLQRDNCYSPASCERYKVWRRKYLKNLW